MNISIKTFMVPMLALVTAGCASADSWHGPSSHDAAGLKALLADRVEVLHRPWSDDIRIVVSNGTMGHYCNPDAFGHSCHVERWTTRVRTNGYRAVITPLDQPTGWLVRYSSITGEVVTGGPGTGIRWIGHLQDTIPAVTYELCRGFPKPHELGFEVNEQQTAKTYRRLVYQDPEAILKGL